MSDREPTLTLTREELAELRRAVARAERPASASALRGFVDHMGRKRDAQLALWGERDRLLAMAERCAEAEEERDEAWDDLIYQRTTVAEEIESLREQYANAGHGLSAEKYLRYRAATALEERDEARAEVRRVNEKCARAESERDRLRSERNKLYEQLEGEKTIRVELAEIARVEERERCARLVEQWRDDTCEPDCEVCAEDARKLAAAIRDRSDK